ncbi:MAG: proton-conducting transporter membrane subunit [Planctomycetaceae bacterium]
MTPVMLDAIFQFCGICVVVAPTVLLFVLGMSALLGLPLSERNMSRCTEASVIAGLTAAIIILVMMLLTGVRRVPIGVGNWMSIPQEHFHFHLKFVFDRLSVPFAILTYVLVGTIGAFANRYLHREVGYGRFFLLFSVFLLGMILATLAGTIETLFLGWELVGLSSALLVAYFHERPAPVRNGQRVWSVYRITDAAFLIAAVVMHHMTGEGDFAGLMGADPWPEGQAALSSSQALFVGLLLLLAAAGKSALIPFSGWLPRAMEGPTPSSAVFYGALSAHLGVFLLLRVSPILNASFWLCVVTVVLGLCSAVLGAMAARVQSDVKSALAYSSLTQVGIITAEIGLGLRYIALVHIIGHACLRTLQLLRAPTLLRDYHQLENAIGTHLPRQKSVWGRMIPERLVRTLYRFSLERGYLDDMIDEFIVHPFQRAFRWCDRMERRWTDFLSGSTPSRDLSKHPSLHHDEEKQPNSAHAGGSSSLVPIKEDEA